MPLIEVENLKTHFPVRGPLFGKNPDPVRAVDGVSFSIETGTTVGLVGESGSGKSTLGKTILKLIPATAGIVIYDNTDILPLPEKQFRPQRRHLQMLFQDPFSSLDPRMAIADIIAEPVDIHLGLTKPEKTALATSLLEKVGLPKDSLTRYPHEFSGGQRQRIGIARALATEPRFLVLDEPVSALDVSVQAQIVNLLQDLQQELGLTYLFIGHDLAVVEHISDHVLVMLHGKIVESAPAARIYNDPQHPYTRELLASAAA
ncbi:MAG: ATP-binding cassette domain-containing protein [Verrucomicrobiales bacterium]|nr:ATP-binding cassette domain-containing protein [Verrucomicrobiales bacterium]